MTRPQAVFIDLYETLITEFDPNFVPTPTIANRLQVSSQRFLEEWRKNEKRRLQGAIPDFVSALHEICYGIGISPPEDVIQQLLEERIEAKAKSFQCIDESIFRMLKQLRDEKDVKLGLISNAASEEVGAWATCSIAPFFDDVVFSYEVGVAKPDEQIYHLACERLDVLAGASLFVGDGGSNELLGAKKAGLKPFWAVWFLKRWPRWKMSEYARQENAQFRELNSPEELVAINLWC